MTFLAPGYLVLVAAVVIPVVLHFLSQRAIKSRPFSSLVFVEAVAHSAVRWARITQRRLLALRISLLAMAVLALARPACTPPPPALTVVALDGSASMGAAGGTVWREAQEIAAELARTIAGPVQIGFATHTLTIMGPRTGPDRTQAIQGLMPTGTALDIRRVAEDAAEFARTAGSRIRLVLVSDFQPNAWEGDVEVSPEVELWGARVAGAVGNLAVGPLSLTGTVRGEGLIQIGGSIRRWGQTDDSCRVTLVTPQGATEMMVPLAADETPFSFRIPRPMDPLARATVLIDDRHGLVLDDRREAARWSRKRCLVAVVGPDSETRNRTRAALDPDDDGRWGFDATCGVDSADVVVIPGATDPGPEADRAIHRWMNGGGLVLVADSDHLSARGRVLFQRTLGAAPLFVRGTSSASAAPQYDHPVLAPFRQLSPRGFSPPHVSRVWAWRGKGVSVIGLQDDALLLEPMIHRHGRVLAFMTGFVPPWSDWASMASFVALMQLAVDHAAGGLSVQSVPFNVEFDWDAGVESDGFTLQFPDGASIPVTAGLTHEGLARTHLGPFVDPGLYSLWRTGQPVALFEPEVPEEEQAVCDPVTPPSVAAWVDHLDVGLTASPAREPATLLFVFALGILLGEAWLAIRITRGAPAASVGEDRQTTRRVFL